MQRRKQTKDALNHRRPRGWAVQGKSESRRASLGEQ